MLFILTVALGWILLSLGVTGLYVAVRYHYAGESVAEIGIASIGGAALAAAGVSVIATAIM